MPVQGMCSEVLSEALLSHLGRHFYSASQSHNLEESYVKSYLAHRKLPQWMDVDSWITIERVGPWV